MLWPLINLITFPRVTRTTCKLFLWFLKTADFLRHWLLAMCCQSMLTEYYFVLNISFYILWNNCQPWSSIPIKIDLIETINDENQTWFDNYFICSHQPYSVPWETTVYQNRLEGLWLCSDEIKHASSCKP